MSVIVVESPAKARKIQSFFTDGTKCISSCGHIKDLEAKTMSIDVDNNFKPKYVICEGKRKFATTLRNYSKTHEIILAADDDREGHAIAWHCAEVAKMDTTKPTRITFHEISKSALKRALDNIHTLNMNEVYAQQARRLIDRLVGFSLSPLLWKHIPGNHKGLSAGRVQSTLLHMLHTHNRQRESFTPEIHSVCKGQFKDANDNVLVVANSQRHLGKVRKLEDEEALKALKHDLKDKKCQQNLEPKRTRKLALEHAGIISRPFTSFGVHDDHLVPEKNYAYISPSIFTQTTFKKKRCMGRFKKNKGRNRFNYLI